jgi:hypothetical protein
VRAAALLEGWGEYSARFRKVAPAVAVALGQQQGSDATSATAAAP